MSQAEKGSKVKVHYTGSLEDGTIFDSSKERDPLEFTIGQEMVIPGFEKGVEGMAIGDSKTVNIPCADAYGERDDRLAFKVPSKEFPQDIEPEVGMMLQVQSQDGGMANVTVTSVDVNGVTLDANHPLAGKDLVFEIELMEIVE